jgi:DNA-binding PucR family transcriptional regulator
VAYRLDRIESLLGRRLDGPVIGRLAAALLARDLLDAG